ncbi:MAG: apolipoprotein A1/A4/E family protein [Thermoprotei archaeon]|nr:apolipoprotein A1/A4/E family protein [Thermoprotei archaeon]
MTGSLLTTVLDEVVKRIARKVASGKRLSDSEVMILLLDQMNRRMEEGFKAVDIRFNNIEKNFNTRLDGLKGYIDTRFNEMEKDFNSRFDSLKAYIDAKFNDLERNFNSRLDALKDYVDGRLSEMSKRIDDLSKMIHALSIEVSSIKTDIIKILRERKSP